MTRPAFEMADIVRRRGKQFLERFKVVLSYQQLKAYRAVKRCRTAALGGHRDKCEDCTLLPCCLHPAPRAEPAGTDFTQATA